MKRMAPTSRWGPELRGKKGSQPREGQGGRSTRRRGERGRGQGVKGSNVMRDNSPQGCPQGTVIGAVGDAIKEKMASGLVREVTTGATPHRRRAGRARLKFAREGTEGEALCTQL